MKIYDNTQQMEDIAARGYSFSLEKYFSEGWKLFKKSPGLLIFYTLLFIVASTVISSVPIFGWALGLVLSPVLSAGFYLVYQKLDKGETAVLGDFFKSFDHIVQLAILGIVVGICTGIGFILFVLPGIWFAIAVSLSGLLVVLLRFEFLDAIKGSIKIVNQNWFSFFALFFLLVLLNIGGLIAFGIGMLVTLPVSYGIVYACFRDIVLDNLSTSQAENSANQGAQYGGGSKSDTFGFSREERQYNKGE